ncbi:nitroreductase [Halobacillus locisalis]|uniref:Nitroreductase n=1 Tax=Halobacillus locisalis TaxID=220753 RepID=A0A838CUR4_9BACI|nr:nitroreductase [Halobacillus locisalis]MBA2175643.1 nitroreductase [Halobacillus locisalis]
MDVQEAILGRRSIHEFKKGQVPSSDLKQIFERASWAPTHRMKQPWMMKVYQGGAIDSYASHVLNSYDRQGFFSGYDADRGGKMREGIKKFLINIPHHVLVYMERDVDQMKYEEDYAAVCAFIQNAQLLAWEQGIGMLWTTSPYLHDAQFAVDVGLNERDYKLVSVLQVGYPSRIPKPKQRAQIEESITFYE